MIVFWLSNHVTQADYSNRRTSYLVLSHLLNHDDFSRVLIKSPSRLVLSQMTFFYAKDAKRLEEFSPSILISIYFVLRLGVNVHV
jgi:hypothetical protein